MKLKRLAVVAMAVGLHSSIANAAGETCAAFADMAAAVQHDRINGATLSQELKNINSNSDVPERVKENTSIIVRNVYLQEDYLDRSSDEARIIFYRRCMNTPLANQ
jgi:hypothetical protein